MNIPSASQPLRFFGLVALCAAMSSASATTYNVTTSAQFNTALNAVMPGDTIILSGNITNTAKYSTKRDGSSTNPITITGDGTAILNGSNNYGLEVLHNYYRLSNFKIQNAMKALVIDSADHGIVDNVHALDIDQEAFKIRNSSHYWLFTNCSARRTGATGTPGEGFYVGQAHSNWINDGTPDDCSYVTFYNCYVTDTVNDGWDVKEGSHHIKIVNCTADYSGSIEPAHNDSLGSAGIYLRADNLQVIKCNVNSLSNGDWAYRISNQSYVVANVTIDYGSTGNEIKESSVTSGNVALIYAEGNTGARVYTDCVPGPGGLKHATSSTIQQPAPGTFTEMTWTGEGGGIYGNLSGSIGAAGDPLSTPTAAPVFNPAAANYAGPLNVTITSATSNATIRYTTNGTTPTSSNGTVYSAPVAINSTATLKAIAYKSGLLDSTVTSGNYAIGLINDTFTDNERATQSLPGSGAWYANSGGTLSASSGNLAMTPSVTGLAYFTAGGSPRVVAVGGTLQAAFKLKANGSGLPTGNDYFRAILLNSSGTSSDHNASGSASRVSADGYSTSTAAFVNNAGYMIGSSLNPGSAATMKIYRRNFSASGGISSSSAYTQMGSNGGTGGVYGFVSGSTYNGTLLVQRTSPTSVTVSLSFTGTFANGGAGTWTYSQTDSTAATYTFDMVAFFLSSPIAGLTNLELDDITVTQTP